MDDFSSRFNVANNGFQEGLVGVLLCVRHCFGAYCCHQDLMQDFEKGKLESFKQEHAVLKEKQLRLLKEVGIAKHVALMMVFDLLLKRTLK